MNRNFVIASAGIGAVAVGLIIWFLLFVPTDGEPDWALHIVVLNVGQAGAIVMVDPNGQACVIDAGRGSTAAGRVADFLGDEDENGAAEIDNVRLRFATHYDQDHMGGFAPLINSRGMKFSPVCQSSLKIQVITIITN